MKKILFGSATAICIVIGLSSFTHSNVTYYWFRTSDALQSAPPNIGVQFDNSQIASFLDTSSSKTLDPTDACGSGGPNWCDVAFTANAVVATIGGGFKLNTSSLNPSFVNTAIINQFNPQ